MFVIQLLSGCYRFHFFEKRSFCYESDDKKIKNETSVFKNVSFFKKQVFKTNVFLNDCFFKRLFLKS